MKRVAIFIAAAVALIALTVVVANGDVVTAVTSGSSVASSTASTGSLVDSVSVEASIGPKIQLTLPVKTIDFGNVYPGDTGNQNYNVLVKSTSNYTIARAYGANDLGLNVTNVSGVVNGVGGAGALGAQPSGEATFTQNAAIAIGWAASGKKVVPVNYTVTW